MLQSISFSHHIVCFVDITTRDVNKLSLGYHTKEVSKFKIFLKKFYFFLFFAFFFERCPTPGSVYSACTFANKLAQGVSGWLVGVTLTVSGYVAGSVTQTVHATQGIFWSNALVLIAGGLLGAAAMLPYNLNKKTFNKILKEIEDRKNNK